VGVDIDNENLMSRIFELVDSDHDGHVFF